MGIYNNGNPVKWGNNGKEWYVIGEYSDYFILLLKEPDGEVTYDCSAYSHDTAYPVEWDDQGITVTLHSWCDKEFSDEDKANMLSTSIRRMQGAVAGYTFKLYAMLLTATQVNQYLPKGSSIRGSGWWVKKDTLMQELNTDIVVTSDGFRGASTDNDNGLRPAIGVKKSALSSKYKDIYSTESLSYGSSYYTSSGYTSSSTKSTARYKHRDKEKINTTIVSAK